MTQNISGGEVSAKKTNEKKTYIRDKQAIVEDYPVKGERLVLDYNYEEIQHWVGKILSRKKELLIRLREAKTQKETSLWKNAIELEVLGKTDRKSNIFYDVACRAGMLTPKQQSTFDDIRREMAEEFDYKRSYFERYDKNNQNGGMSNRNYDVAQRVADALSDDEPF